MKTDRSLALLKNRLGMTLVEVIVAVAIVAIASLVLVTAFNSSFRIIQRSADTDVASDQAFKDAENSSLSGSAGTLHFTAGGTNLAVNGSFASFSKGTDAGVTFYTFIPGN